MAAGEGACGARPGRARSEGSCGSGSGSGSLAPVFRQLSPSEPGRLCVEIGAGPGGTRRDWGPRLRSSAGGGGAGVSLRGSPGRLGPVFAAEAPERPSLAAGSLFSSHRLPAQPRSGLEFETGLPTTTTTTSRLGGKRKGKLCGVCALPPHAAIAARRRLPGFPSARPGGAAGVGDSR